MARVVVIHPYLLQRDPPEAKLGRPYPPLSTLTAVAELERHGHSVEVLDPTFSGTLAEAVGQLQRVLPGADRLIVAADDHSVQVKQCLGAVREAHQALARVGAEAQVPTLVSGPDVSDHPDAYLQAGATSAVVGDPITAVASWADGDAAIPGVHGAQGGGGRRPNPDDLGALPRAAWSRLDLRPYARAWRARHGHWELNVWTARGCPYRCNWCAKPTWGRSYAVRPAEQVAVELAWLRAHAGPDRVWFTDDLFGLRPEWLVAFRRGVERHLGAPLPYRCLSRADLLADRMSVAELAASGCDEVWFGAESGSDRVLQAMDKDATVADAEAAVAHLRRFGVRSGLFLQLGYPGEDLTDVEATIDMVRRVRPDAIGVSVSYPLPGTVFYERVREHLHGAPWQVSMENRPRFPAPYDQAFYRAAREVLRSTWSATTTGRALLAALRRPGRRSARRVLGGCFHAARLPFVTRRMRRLAVANPDALSLSR